jgi:hypothetical protein
MECEDCSGSGRTIDLGEGNRVETCWVCGGSGQVAHIFSQSHDALDRIGPEQARRLYDLLVQHDARTLGETSINTPELNIAMDHLRQAVWYRGKEG